MGFPRRGSIGPRGLRRLGSTGTVSCAFGREGPNQTVWGGLGKSQHGGGLLGWALRDRACTRRDRTGGGASRCRAFGNWLLRSDARFGAVPLRLRCLGFGLFGDRLKADGGWDSWCVLLLGGGLRGTGPALAGIVREVGFRAAALWEWGASIQCSLRPYPAAARFVSGGRGVKSF